MKYIGELALLSILIVLFYQKENFLTSHVRNNRSTFLLVVVGLILFLGSYQKYNMCFILAFIVVVLISNTVEGNKTLAQMENTARNKEGEYPPTGQEFKNEAAPGQPLNQTPEDFKKDRKYEKDLAEEFTNLNPMELSSINMVDNDRTLKLNALKNSEVAKTNSNEISNGVVNDVKDVLERVKRLELLQEEAEAAEFEDDEEEDEDY